MFQTKVVVKTKTHFCVQ